MAWPPSRAAIALAAFAVVVIAVVVYAITRPGPSHASQPPVTAEISAPASAIGSSSAPVATHTAPATALKVSLPKGPVTATFFGDAYVVGYGADPKGKGFVQHAAQILGWNATFNGVIESGYCSTHPQNYVARLKALPPSPAPTIFILEGGINDVGCSPTDLAAQITASIKQIKTVYPSSLLVLLGPAVPTKYNAPQLLPIDTAINQAATAAGVPYISPLNELWFTSANRIKYLSPGGVYPNQAGYNYLTTLLVQDLVQVAGATLGGTTADVVSSPASSAVASGVASATPGVTPSAASPSASRTSPSPSPSF
jgi:lysophospholipase L1-like esterase